MDRLNVAPKLPNPAGNITHNSANQLLTFNDKNISYDANGNMETITNSCGTTTYIWNVRNQLAGISGFDADCSTLTASFKYDALGRRIEKSVNGKTIQYVYDGLDIVQEIEDGTVTVNYIRTLNIDEPMVRVNSNGTARYYQQDALGSVIALTDETGTIRTQYNYDPFGNTTITGDTSDNPFQFAGRENDNTGLLFERNRYYSLDLQRYISQDPIGFAGGDVNWYVRVGNNPVNWIDPTGEIGIVGGLIGASVELGLQAYRNYHDDCDLFSLDNYDIVDVGASAIVGALGPGWMTVGKTVLRSGGAVGTLSRQSAQTANRAAKIQQRIRRHQNEAADSLIVQGAFQGIKAIVKNSNDSSDCKCRD